MRFAKRTKAFEMINVIALAIAVLVADIITANCAFRLEAMVAVFLIVLVEFFCVELNLTSRSESEGSTKRRKRPTAIYKRRYQFAAFWLVLALLAWLIDGLRYIDTIQSNYWWTFIHPALVFLSVVAVGLLTAGIVWSLQRKKLTD